MKHQVKLQDNMLKKKKENYENELNLNLNSKRKNKNQLNIMNEQIEQFNVNNFIYLFMNYSRKMNK
ncbi:hypothetical protein RFI_04827 [Reticulomyxa filosa]|uniref:Uncharacterized protein n=1 Tax=Reticulomyxa filosa TaxID=46433 RepID=X6P148_RETFI|nr:hypothetical protein RFI_04827 [Reticulomyxa filosa]|eukprot:ETO32290.1 hypothetical protein RFI_04827 [Reticulomyxa filosa]